MNQAVGLSEAAFGLGAGLFFIGYFLFEVPSNIFLERVGARVWIARIMITWELSQLLSLLFHRYLQRRELRMKGFFTVFVCCLAHVRRVFSLASFSI